jgi:hypothetical protein
LASSPPFPLIGVTYPPSDIVTSPRHVTLPSHRAKMSSLPLLHLPTTLCPVASPFKPKPKHYMHHQCRPPSPDCPTPNLYRWNLIKDPFAPYVSHGSYGWTGRGRYSSIVPESSSCVQFLPITYFLSLHVIISTYLVVCSVTHMARTCGRDSHT